MSNPPRCISVTLPRARKTHVCCECGDAIEPGRYYHRVTGVRDMPETFKQCAPCGIVFRAAWEYLPAWRVPTWIEWDEGPCYTGLREYLRNLDADKLDAIAVASGLEEHIARLVAGKEQ